MQIGKFSSWESLFESRDGGPEIAGCHEIEIWVSGKKVEATMKIDDEGDGFFDREWSKHRLTDDEIKTLDITKVRTTFSFLTMYINEAIDDSFSGKKPGPILCASA